MADQNKTYAQLLEECEALREEIANHNAQPQTQEKSLIQAFDEIGQTLLSTLDLDTIIDKFCMQVVEFGVFRSLMVALVNHEKETVTVVRRLTHQGGDKLVSYQHALTDSYLNNKERIIYDHTSPNITAEVARTGQMLIIDGWDDRFAPHTPQDQIPSQNTEYRDSFKDKVSYFIPIINQGKTQAVLATASRSKDKQTILETIETMQPLLNLISLVLQHAQLYQTTLYQAATLEVEVQKRTQELEDQIQRQEILLNVSHAIQKMQNPEDLWHVIHTCNDGLQCVCPSMEAITIHHLISKDKKLFDTYRLTPQGQFSFSTGVQSSAFKTWQKARVVYRKDLNQKLEGLTKNFVQTSQSKYGFEVQCMLSVPFPQGVMIFVSSKPHAFTDQDISLIQKIVAMFSVSIARLEDLEQIRLRTQDLEAQNAELERFTYTVSHDLKSPLITIRGFVDQVEKDAKKGDIERLETDIEFIRNAAQNMEHLLDDLLELSRIGRLVNPLEVISLSELTQQASDLLTGPIQNNNVKLHIEPNLPNVFGDRTRLLEVFQNLIENAIKFMGDQKTPCIEIGTRQKEGQTVLYVKDNGMGIAPQYHTKIFGLFDRLDQNKEGTGIGLALVKRIIEHHAGQIWVESEGNNTGSTFCLTLPLKTTSP